MLPGIMFLRFILMHRAAIYLFTLINSILLYKCVKMYIFFQSTINGYMLFSLGGYHEQCCYKYSHTGLVGTCASISLGMTYEWNHSVIEYVHLQIFPNNSKQFSKEVVPVYTPTSNAQEPMWLHTQQSESDLFWPYGC